MTPLIDIGINLGHASFRADRDAVIERGLAAGVGALIITGTSEAGSRQAAALARERPGVLFATAGVHPHHAKDYHPETTKALAALASKREVVAIGECGLDFNRDFSPRPLQEKAFEAQLALAAEVNLPVFLHERDAHERFVAILKPYLSKLPGAVVHCFTGTAPQLTAYLDLGCAIGITGWICDERRGKHLADLIPKIPADRLMIETDAPFLTPRNLPKRPTRNEPAYLPHVLASVASAAKKPVEQVAEETTRAARGVFGKMGSAGS